MRGLELGGVMESSAEPSYGARLLERPAQRVSSRRVPPSVLVRARQACCRPTLARFHAVVRERKVIMTSGASVRCKAGGRGGEVAWG